MPDVEELFVNMEDTDEQEEECEVSASAAAPAVVVFIFFVASLARHFSGVLRSGEVPKIELKFNEIHQIDFNEYLPVSCSEAFLCSVSISRICGYSITAEAAQSPSSLAPTHSESPTERSVSLAL